MPKIEQKQVVINEIKEKLDKSLSIVLVDARGLTVEQDTVLRRKLREAGIDYKVYKNSMMDFAVKDTEFAPIAEYLVGPSTMAFSYDDATGAARIIAGEMKTMPNLEFKAGVVEGTLYDAKGIEAISKIPGREELLSKLLGSFKSPVSTFARVIKAIAEKKESGDDIAQAPGEEVKAEETPTAEVPADEVKAEETPVAEEAKAEEAPAEEDKAQEAPAADAAPEESKE